MRARSAFLDRRVVRQEEPGIFCRTGRASAFLLNDSSVSFASRRWFVRLTERAIHSSDRAVFWNELPRSTGARASRLVTPGAICALACGITLRKRSLGALVVKSDRYDLSEEQQGPLLERLAAEAARWLQRCD